MPERLDRPSRTWKRLLAGAAVVIFASAATTAGAAFNELDGVVHALDRTPPLKLGPTLAATAPGKPQTLLLLGSDKRATGAVDASSPPHTDTMMLMRIDPAQSSIGVMSIPRDLKVKIDAPGHGRIAGKINSAYTLGGAKLAVETVSATFGIAINHVVDTNFTGFRQAVDLLGCVYVDVDHHYYNDNAGAGPRQQYATINVPAGYQRLCGSDALDYVRYRHNDSDFVRVSRQQDFIRQVRDQVAGSRLLSRRQQLATIFGSATETDIHSPGELVRIGGLLALAGGRTIRQVHFPAAVGLSYVTASSQQIQQAVHELFTAPAAHPRAAAPPAAHHGGGAAGPPPVYPDPVNGRLAAHRVATGVAVWYPTAVAPGAVYGADSRSYNIEGDGPPRSAYRLVVQMGSPGDYYGIEGVAWQNPPILAHPSEHRTIAGRRFDLYYSGQRLRLVAWHTATGSYWISNSLMQALSDQQMLALAASTRPYR